jgi:hypothetical protein
VGTIQGTIDVVRIWQISTHGIWILHVIVDGQTLAPLARHPWDRKT